jgi:hypothetical protein
MFGLPATTDPALKLGRFLEGALLLLQYVHDVERIRQNVRNLICQKDYRLFRSILSQSLSIVRLRLASINFTAKPRFATIDPILRS